MVDAGGDGCAGEVEVVSARQLPKSLDQFGGGFGVQLIQVDFPELLEEWIRQRGEEAVLEGAAGFHLFSDRAFGQARVGAVLLFQELEDLTGTIQNGRRHAGQPGDVDAVALVGAAGQIR